MIDFMGNGDPETPMPDDDPIDNCSAVSHGNSSFFFVIDASICNLGTHVAGLIAANTSGIIEKEFISPVPFIGVAPRVTIGACKFIDYFLIFN